MTAIAADIKGTFAAAITDLKERELGKHREKAIRRLEEDRLTHSGHLIAMNRQLEDLDNRRRPNNIRLRGILESVENENIRPVLTSIFSNLLDRPPESPIELDRAHMALRPKAPNSAPPRDIICCLSSHILKGEILHKARQNDQILFKEAPIQLYQDLSPITLKNRRAVRPVLDALMDKNIPYRWKFPFAVHCSGLISRETVIFANTG